jgi:1,4-dihydroxy-2-naphthoyl-CoA synthase
MDMGMVQRVPQVRIRRTVYEWAQEILQNRLGGYKCQNLLQNLTDDGMVGQQVFMVGSRPD